MVVENCIGTVPDDLIVGDGPIEHRNLASGERKTQSFGVARLSERTQTIPQSLLKDLTPHDLHQDCPRSVLPLDVETLVLSA